MTKRSLSGIYIRYCPEGSNKFENVCFEELPEDVQDDWLMRLDERGLKSLAKSLANTLKRIGDAFDLHAGE